MTIRASIIFLAVLAAACGKDSGTETQVSVGVEHLNARPQSGVTTVAPGTYLLTVSGGTNCCTLQIPTTTSTGKLPLLVMLHGAGGTEAEVAKILALGEELDYAVLAPKSTNASWDVVYGGFGVDVVRINNALKEVFQRVNVDANHIALAGFSDGASYAISLGLANGDLFTHVIAFSPGFMSAVPRIGKPLYFIAHGTRDGVLPFEGTRDLFVPFLKTLGYTVRFDSFNGGHTVDDAEARAASLWFLL